MNLLTRIATAKPIEPEVSVVVPGRVLHVDGDMLAYIGGGTEDTTVAASRGMVRGKIRVLLNASGAESAVVHLTASNSTKGDRHIIATTLPYQDHRRNKAKPYNWKYLRDWMESYTGPDFTPKIWYDREADDGFGFAGSNRPGAVIATKDKDMRMVVGTHLDWDTLEMVEVKPDTYEVTHNNKVYGMKWFLLQLLQGDKADNIPGIGAFSLAPQGCGPVTACRLLDGSQAADGGQIVVNLYKEAHGDAWADRLAEQASLLWIRRGDKAEFHEWLYDSCIMHVDSESYTMLRKACNKIQERIHVAKEVLVVLDNTNQDEIEYWNIKE